MKVKAIWEFEVDTEDFMEEFVNIKGLAKDLTQREMENLLHNQEISAEDFSYEVESEVDDMEFRSAIVDELGCVMYWCDELQDEDQIECILNSHPEWSRKCIEI